MSEAEVEVTDGEEAEKTVTKASGSLTEGQNCGYVNSNQWVRTTKRSGIQYMTSEIFTLWGWLACESA